MLNTGPRSYYDDYLRKKSTTRVVEDPTALLTDRNAYVNFLEVQLERVSAACLAVQSSEQRFNDLTGMIQTLEQRCTANIKLIGLAQQCTEQVRAEGDRKYELLMKQQEDDRHSFERHLRQLTVQLTQQERKLEQYEPLQKRVTECERDITSLQDELHALKEHLIQVEDDKNALAAQLEEEREDRKKMENQLSDTMSANHQKLLSMVDEHHHELSQMYQESVDRFQDLFNAQQESLIEAQQSHRRNVDVAVQKQVDTIEQIKADFIDRLNTHYGDLSQEMVLMRESIQEEIDSSIVRSVQTSEELKAAVKLAISEQVQEIRYNIVSEVEDRVVAESQRVLDEYIFLAQSFGDGDASIMYPDAPAPSVNDADSASQRRSSIRSVASLNELKRVPSMMSERSVDSQKSSRKGKSPTKQTGVGRQELDAIHNTLQALLEMHRQDVLSIHHRLDAMQVPLGVAPAKPLSRRNSVVKQMDAELKHIPSSHTIDTSISALSMKSFLSDDQSAAEKSRTSTVKSKSSLAKKAKAKKAAASAAEEDDVANASASRQTVMKKRLSFAQASSEKNGSMKEEASLKRKSSRAKSSDDLDLSGESSDSDSSSDYEDVAQPYELSGSMSFISNKSKDTSRVSKVPTKKIKAPIVKRDPPVSKTPQASTQRSTTAPPSVSSSSSQRPVVRRKAPTVIATMPVIRKSTMSPSGRSTSRRSSLSQPPVGIDTSSILSTTSSSRKQWKHNNTFVSNTIPTARTASAGNDKSKATHRHTSGSGCGGCAQHPTGSIKDTVVNVDGCCRYCGKDLQHLDHRGVDTIRVHVGSEAS